jgi:hypothetical protein
MKTCCCVIVAILLSACSSSSSNLPKYVAPKDLAEDQAVTLKGHGGTYVTAVDMLEVRGSTVQMGNFGGNSVTLTPGKHRITYSVGRSSSMSFSTSTNAFEHDFKPGHTYKLGPMSMFKSGIILYDDTAKETQGGV